MDEQPELADDNLARDSEAIVNAMANAVISQVAKMAVAKELRAPLVYGIGVRIMTELAVHLQEPDGAPDRNLKEVAHRMLMDTRQTVEQSFTLSLESRRDGLVTVGDYADDPTIQ